MLHIKYYYTYVNVYSVYLHIYIYRTSILVISLFSKSLLFALQMSFISDNDDMMMECFSCQTNKPHKLIDSNNKNSNNILYIYIYTTNDLVMHTFKRYTKSTICNTVLRVHKVLRVSRSNI